MEVPTSISGRVDAMRHRTRFPLAAVLLLTVVSCGGGDKGAEKPDVTFDGTIVVTGMVNVQGEAGTTMAGAIYLLDAQGTRQVANNGALQDAYPAWSPDGTQIAYITVDYQLAVINRDGTGGAALTPKSSDQSLWASHPEWLPDGNIAIETDGKLVVLAPDGTGVAVLTPPGFTNRYTVSPDGKQVVYDRSTSIANEVWRFDIETGASQLLLTSPRPFDSLSWSPDGTQIVGGSSTGGQDLSVDAAYDDLYVFGADGSGLRALPQPGEECNPVWSPDGTKIVYNAFTGSGSDTELDLWMMNADGTDATRLLGSALRQPDWTTP